MTRHFIDRRLNPGGKNLGNQQRFLRRTKEEVRKKIDTLLQGKKIKDVGTTGEDTSVPERTVREPHFRQSNRGGFRERVLGGNKDFTAGDRIRKPQSGQGKGGKEGSDRGDGEDEFEFTLSRDQFLDLFFEDLELPDLIKKDLRSLEVTKPERSGYTTEGSPARLAVVPTMRGALGRRIALKRPSEEEIETLERELDERRALDGDFNRWRVMQISAEIETLRKKRRLIGFIDPIDIRYRNYEQKPQPNTKAVMFCLMDVSGSMGEREKDLAKRFFILLHLFLRRQYERIDIVFIRHTHQASVVDEDTFFYSRESGGTVVSTAILEMLNEIKRKYSPREWNIYAAQASDGENFAGDSVYCAKLLLEEVMPQLQYYAYVEILDERDTNLFNDPKKGGALWRAYRDVAAQCDNFAMKRVGHPSNIYPVFRELFEKKGV